MKVLGKFKCEAVTPTGTGEDAVVTLRAHTGPGSEDFAKYTPWGDIRFGLSGGTRATQAFVPGKVYDVTFQAETDSAKE